MKTRFVCIGVIAAIVLGIATFFVGCKEEVNDIVNYKGHVVYINTTTPFADLTIKVTDGSNTHCQTRTDAGGDFSLKVRVSEIDGSYYLLAGDSTCVPKKVALSGFGQAEVDLGVIEVEGPALPTVSTAEPKDITADGATVSGNVIDDGRIAVTERGICYSEKQYSEVSDKHIVIGKGLGKYLDVITDLKPNTKYYVRAYATNRVGTSYGEQYELRTTDGLPTVKTSIPTSIIENTISISGEIENDYGYKIIEKGFCYSNTIQFPNINNGNKIVCEGDVSIFSTSILLQNPSTETYYICAYATNINGTSYGNIIIVSPELYEYFQLKTMKYNGFTYIIKCFNYDVTWEEANNICQSLDYGGFSDWFLPNSEEVLAILIAYGVWGKTSYDGGEDIKVDGLSLIHTSTLPKCDDGRYSHCVYYRGGVYHWVLEDGYYDGVSCSWPGYGGQAQFIAVRKYK